MKNQVIKNLSPEMGKEIIKYFQSLGVDTNSYSGTTFGDENSDYSYYGVIKGSFEQWRLSDVQANNAEIIELPKVSEFKRGDKVLVWDNDEKKVYARTYIAYIEGAIFPHIVIDSIAYPFLHSAFKNCKAIPVKEEPILVELTLQDISDGKGVGIPVELIRIKAD